MKSIPHHSLVVGLMVMGLGLVVCGVWLMTLGDSYEATVVIVIQRNISDIKPFDPSKTGQPIEPLSKESKEILSDEVLSRAMEALARVMAEDRLSFDSVQIRSITEFKSKISAIPAQDSRQINIRARGTTSETATLLSMAVAKAYLDFKCEEMRQERKLQIDKQESVFYSLQDQVRGHKAKIDKLTDDMNVTALEASTWQERLDLPTGQTNTVRNGQLRAYDESRSQLNALQERLKRLENELSVTSPDNPLPVAPIYILDGHTKDVRRITPSRAEGFKLAGLGVLFVCAGGLVWKRINFSRTSKR